MKPLLTIILVLLLSGNAIPVFSEYGDIVLDSKLKSMEKAEVKAVLFPHWFHRVRFKCKACHEEIFKLGKGINDISMRAIMDGEYCGKCHNGIIAWEPLYCDKCHSYTPPGEKITTKNKAPKNSP